MSETTNIRVQSQNCHKGGQFNKKEILCALAHEQLLEVKLCFTDRAENNNQI